MSSLDPYEEKLRIATRSPWDFFRHHSLSEMLRECHPDRHPEEKDRAGIISVGFQEEYGRLKPGTAPPLFGTATAHSKTKSPELSDGCLWTLIAMSLAAFFGLGYGWFSFGFLEGLGLFLIGGVGALFGCGLFAAMLSVRQDFSRRRRKSANAR